MSAKKHQLEKEMVPLKIPIDSEVLETLEVIASSLGMKTNAYIQFIIGKHVKDEKGTK
jgi:hypothetical protein